MATDLAYIGIAIDTSQVKSGEEVVRRSFANMGESASAMTRRVDESNKHLTAITDALRRLSAQAEQSNTYLRAVAEAHQNAAGAVARHTEVQRTATQTAEEAAKAEAIVARQRELMAQRVADIAAREAKATQMTTAAVHEHTGALNQTQLAHALLTRLRNQSRDATEREWRAIQRLPPAIKAEEEAVWKLAGAIQRQSEVVYQRQRAEAATFMQAGKTAQATTQVAAAAERSGAAASASTAGIGRMRQSMTSLAIAASGVPGPIGRVASAAGNLAIGSALTIGIVAGVAAISAVYRKLTEDARKAREENDKLRTSLLSAAEAYRAQDRPIEVLNERLGKLATQRRAIQKQLDDEVARGPARYSERSGLLIPGTGIDEGKVARLRAELRDLGREAAAAGRQAAEQFSANQRTVEQATTGAAKSFGDLGDFQRMVASDIARAQGDAAALIQLEYEEKLAKVETAFAKLSASGQRSAQAIKDQLEVVLRLERDLALTGTDRITPRVTGQPGTILTPRGVTTEFGDPVVTAEANARAAQQRYEAALRTATDAFQRGFQSIFENGLAGFDGFFDSVVDLAEQAAASIAAAMTIKALGIDKLLENLTGPGGGSFHEIGKGFKDEGAFAGNVLGGFAAGQIGGNLAGSGQGGALLGAAGGFAIGGHVGAIVGGVTGLISGLTSAGERARELERFRKEFEANLDAFVLAASGGATDLAVAKQQVERNAEVLRDQAIEAAFAAPGVLGPNTQAYADYKATIDKITQAEQDYLALLEEEAKLKRQAIGEDLTVRALRAQGLDEEADAMALRLSQEREWLALQTELGDRFDETLQKQLTQVHQLEREAVARAKAEEASRKETERLERQARLTEDLSVRLLRAGGENDLADTLSRRIAFEREYAQAVKDGMDEVTLAMIEQVYAAEELAIAQAKAADEAERLIDAINAEARATENLTVRHLRATGATDAANEAAQLFAQQEERRRAIEEGRSFEFLAYLDQVQAEERAAADQARQAAQQSAFDAAVRSAFPDDATFLPDSRTNFNLAVGVSESTGGQIAGLMRSALSYQAHLVHLPTINSTLVRIDATLAAVLARGGLATVVDEGLATLGADADAANGVPPGNT